MSFEYFDDEAGYVSKSEISPDAAAKIAKKLGSLAALIS